MKTIIKIFPCIVVLAVSAGAATNYTVKSSGGGNYTTIQSCANAMSAGDTCTVYAGKYNENVTVTAGGAGNYKTLTVTPGDAVYVQSFTINSHVKINGFHIQNPSSPLNAPCVTIAGTSTDFYITNNNMYACGAYMIKVPYGASASHGFIQGNTLSYACSTSSAPNVCKAMSIIGDYYLIENNDISHVADGPILAGKHIVLRKNTFHDVSSNDCGSNSGNCHIDFMQADAPATSPTRYLLIESNTVLNMVGRDMHAVGLFQAQACGGQCFNAIIRFHSAAHVGGGAILDDNSLDTHATGWYNVKAYNNTWVDINNDSGSQLYGGTNGFTHNSNNGAEVNDLFYYPESLANFNPYVTDTSTAAAFSVGHNLAYCTVTPCNLHGKVYGRGNFTDDPGNQVANPRFVNYAGNDFRLQAGSPAIGAGTYLTTVANSDSGSGTSLVVNDAGFFQDGYSIPGVNADCISVTTVANHVCITAVNYQTKTLTLASSIARSAGNPVWLYSDSTGRTVLIGSAPNIGATFASTLAAPRGLSAAVQ